MSDTLLVDKNLSKKEKYIQIIPQIRSIIEAEENLIANLANISSVLKSTFDFFWVGFYLKDQDTLILGPFQGEIACTRIPMNKGVCGASASKQETIIVPDVNLFEGHIACSSLTKSEIVIPLVKDGETHLVLDVDSIKINDFDNVDKEHLEKIVNLIIDTNFKEV